MTRAGYDPASGVCAEGSQPGARALMAWALKTYPEAKNLGIYVCREVRGKEKDDDDEDIEKKVVLSVHADGRAGDTAFPLVDGDANPRGHDLAGRLMAHADELGIQLLIFDNAIWTSKSRKWSKHCGHRGVRGPHKGCSGPHYDHVHWEITWAAARGDRALTTDLISRLLGPPLAPPEEDMRYKDWPVEDKMLLAKDVADAVIAQLGEKVPTTLAAERLLKAAQRKD